MDSRRDLAADALALARALMRLEEPILDRHGLGMWEYAVLTALSGRAPSTQAELARWVGRDQTRLIASLRLLEDDGLVVRERSAEDRRHRTVRLSPQGETRLRACHLDIRAMEEGLLAELSNDDRSRFVSGLGRLARRAAREA